MSRKIKLDTDQEYDAASLSDAGKITLNNLEFSTNRIQELNNMIVLLQRAKNSYIDSLKTQVISNKSGLMLNDD